jgi:serine protease inhibitor
MKIASRLVLLVLAILTATVSCKKTAPVAEKTQTITLPTGGPTVITANNQLAFALLQSTLQQDPANNNKLISPLSIYMALSMLYNGAAHATADSMANTLQIHGLDINTLNTVSKSLITQLPGEDNMVQFSIANSIWYRQNGAQPLAPFLTTTKNDYDASVQSLNFSDPNSVNTINNWVAQKTNNKIPTVINALTPEDLMYLINAIYFNGAWQEAFKTTDTRNDTFQLQNGSVETVPFMNQEITTNYYKDSSFKMFELPYGGGKSYSMYIVLPNDPDRSIASFAARMDQTRLSAAIGNMFNSTLGLEIPKWEYSYEIANMQPELSQLGMGVAFSDGADFSNLYDPAQMAVKVSKVIHKTYIKVDEEGTQAAAVTGVEVIASAVPAIPYIQANHPFLYCIVEKQTGAVLFVGILNDPALN